MWIIFVAVNGLGAENTGIAWVATTPWTHLADFSELSLYLTLPRSLSFYPGIHPFRDRFPNVSQEKDRPVFTPIDFMFVNENGPSDWPVSCYLESAISQGLCESLDSTRH